jgi:hypothetical protein
MNIEEMVQEFFDEFGDPSLVVVKEDVESILNDFYGHLQDKGFIHPDKMDVQKDKDGDEFYGEGHVDSTITVSNYLFRKGFHKAGEDEDIED